MGGNYGALRLWSTVLIGVGVIGVVFVIIGTIVAMFEAATFGQGLRALADIAETVRSDGGKVR